MKDMQSELYPQIRESLPLIQFFLNTNILTLPYHYEKK
jgi:hypothetical protein